MKSPSAGAFELKSLSFTVYIVCLIFKKLQFLQVEKEMSLEQRQALIPQFPSLQKYSSSTYPIVNLYI